MHILLGLLGTVVTILILLNKLGVDIGWLNPYLWNKRRNWKKKYEGNPVFKLNNPLDVTALLMVAAAKADGDMVQEQKVKILSLFQSEFHLSPQDAGDLMISSVHLLGDGEEVRTKTDKILAPLLPEFKDSQIESALSLRSL